MGSATRILLACAVALVALASLAGTAAAAAPVTHDVSQSPAAVEDYWTPQRMENAQPLDLPAGAKDAQGAQAVAASQAPDQEVPATLDTTYPYRIHGRLFLKFGTV